MTAARARFTLVTPQGSAPVRCACSAPTSGNALTAAALGRASRDGRRHRRRRAVRGARAASKWRMEITELPGGITVINDAYNANPHSMAAALETLTTVARGRRAFAVLGSMNELGDESPQWHEQVGGLAARAGVAGLIVVGEDAAPMLSGAKAERSWHGELIGVPDAGSAVAARREPPGARRRGTGQSFARGAAGTCGACPDRGGSTVKTILVAGGVSLLLALLGTPLAIRVFSRRGYGQLIREEGPAAPRHQARHAHHGRDRHRHRVGGRVLRRATWPPARSPRCPGCW